MRIDGQGQISAEFILIISFIVIIILIFASSIDPQIEENNIIAASREGASAAVSELAYSNASMEPIRLERILSTGGKNKNVTLIFDRPLPENYKSFIINRTIGSILEIGGITRINYNTVKVGDRTYTIVI